MEHDLVGLRVVKWGMTSLIGASKPDATATITL